MLSKCANPSCSAPFRYLHEGKMFQLDMEVMRGPEVRHQGRKLVSKQKWSRKIEHYWLCNACASSQTLVFKKGDGITVVPLERDHGEGARHQQRRSYFELHMALRMINQASRRLKSAYPESRLLPGRKNQNSSESLSFAKS